MLNIQYRKVSSQYTKIYINLNLKIHYPVFRFVSVLTWVASCDADVCVCQGCITAYSFLDSPNWNITAIAVVNKPEFWPLPEASVLT
jgi:hypothetical protein